MQQQQRRTSFKYIVLGLGGIGSSALYWLSKKYGTDVLGIEQYKLTHSNGGSQDHSRIVRVTYNIPEYTRLAQKAFDDWAVVEEESGVKLITMTGSIVFGEKDNEYIRAYAAAMDLQKIPYEELSYEQMKTRFPQFTLTPTMVGLWQAQAGIGDPRLGIQTFVSLSRARGATILEDTPVIKVEPIGKTAVKVYTKDGTVYTAQRLVCASGSWTNNITRHLGFELPLIVSQEQVTYFSTPHVKEFTPQNFPVWIYYGDNKCLYGFPIYGEIATKAGIHEGGIIYSKEVTAETRTFEPQESRTAELVRYLNKYIPRSLGPELFTKTCLYCLTPDRNFVCDVVPGAPQISVFVGAGHAYKFASVLGRILSEFAEGGKTQEESLIQLFKLDRKGLWDKRKIVSRL